MKQIPFYANTPDNTHCFQAAVRMVLKYFLPDKEYSWEELEKFTAKKGDLWTWSAQTLINMKSMGFAIQDIDEFDIEAFVKDGGEYLLKRYGEEVGREQIKHSDIPQEQRLYHEYNSLGIHQNKLPTLEMVKQFITDGYLVLCNINAYTMKNKEGYSAHTVVVFDYTTDSIVLHDPGLPPQENLKVPTPQFLKAWEYPNKRSRNLMAFKLE